MRRTGLFTSHPIPEIESLNPRDHLHGGHDGVDDGEDAAHESKDEGDTPDSKERQKDMRLGFRSSSSFIVYLREK